MLGAVDGDTTRSIHVGWWAWVARQIVSWDGSQCAWYTAAVDALTAFNLCVWQAHGVVMGMVRAWWWHDE